MDTALQWLKMQIDAMIKTNAQVTVAIDGNCTAGKTTLAEKLSILYDCNVFHLDDFFLRPQQRTPVRLAQVGGNIDYERFQTEVLLPLKSGNGFSYRPFNCHSLMLGEPVTVTPKKLNIVEGSYSLHPYFGEPYDLKVLLTIGQELQHQRVLERPVHLQPLFLDKWIPMENTYLNHLLHKAEERNIHVIFCK